MQKQKGPDEVAVEVYSSDSQYPNAYVNVVQETYAKADQYRDFVKLLPIPKSNETLRILEPGPGPSSNLKKAIVASGLPVEQYDITGIDRFTQMMNKDTSMAQANLINLPFASNTFDVVILSSVLLYISDREKAVEECYRVLKPGGRLIVSELDSEVAASVLVRKIFGYEFKKTWELISKDTSISLPNKMLTYILTMYKKIAKVLPSIKVANAVNKEAVKNATGTEGFTLEELLRLIKDSGLVKNIFSGRTYANSYFVIKAEKSEQ